MSLSGLRFHRQVGRDEQRGDEGLSPCTETLNNSGCSLAKAIQPPAKEDGWLNSLLIPSERSLPPEIEILKSSQLFCEGSWLAETESRFPYTEGWSEGAGIGWPKTRADIKSLSR